MVNAARVLPLPNSGASSTRFNLALWTTALLLVIHFARPFEVVLVGYHLPAICCAFGILVLFATGALVEILSPTGIALSAFVVWMLFSVPLSSWRGGSAQYVLWYITFWIVLVLLIAHAPRSPKDLVLLASVTGVSCLFSVLISGGKEVEGRFEASGTFGNANELALLAGYGLPFVALLALQIKAPVLRYAVMLLGCGYLILTVGRTASRGALLALPLMIGVYFLRTKASQKILIVVGTVVGGFVLLLLLPQRTLTRLATIVDAFDSQTNQFVSEDSEANASAAERRDLLMDAVHMTLDHPLFGVGPGEFANYRWDHIFTASGQRKHYFPAHNTFLQISAESGIPGVLFYLAFLWTTYRSTRRIRKLTRSSNHPNVKLFDQLSTCIVAALVYFSVCAFFLTCDRYPHQFAIAGMAIAMERLLKRRLSQNTSPAPAAAPVSRMAWTSRPGVPSIAGARFPVSYHG